MKRLTLDKAWELCLKQWKWIVKQRKKGNISSVYLLKYDWLTKYNYTDIDYPENACFFCEYDSQKKGGCRSCPATKVDKEFLCNDNQYHWSDKPLKFYQKLLELNRKRKKKNAKSKT